MNGGLRDRRQPSLELGRTDFFLASSPTTSGTSGRSPPHQAEEGAAGARFVINQIGYDTRKDDELLRWIRRERLPVAALANVYVLSPPAARAFHRGVIPGVIVTDPLLEPRRAPGGLTRLGQGVRRPRGSPRRCRAGPRLRGVPWRHMRLSTFDEILDVAVDRYAGD